jgi:hypothetical protein
MLNHVNWGTRARRGVACTALLLVEACGGQSGSDTSPEASGRQIIDATVTQGDADLGLDGGTGDSAPLGYLTDGACGPSTCPNGCCNGGSFCVFPAPSTPGFCGGHGGSCVPCASGGYAPDAACSPANCPAGCCNGSGFCVDPPTDQQCGTQGGSCFTCPDGGTCLTGTGCSWPVVGACGPSNCSGCCDQSRTPEGGSDFCLSGTFSLVCGYAGSPCTVCGFNEQCRPLGFDGGGYCQENTTCDPSSCTGCCVGDICAQGNQNEACGYGGVACVPCGPEGSCYGGKCATGGPLVVQDAASE